MNWSNKVVDLRADVHTIWKLQCQNLYNSTNLAALAVRECLQNSVDSICNALKLKQIKQGRIDINVSVNSLSVEDNGIGMDVPTIHEKFLTLGGTTKDNEDNVGGFGLAKSVILGCGSGFTVETQDNKFSDTDLGNNPIQKVAYRQGTKITVYNPQIGKDKTLSSELDSWELVAEIKDYIVTSQIPKNIDIYVDGTKQQLIFKPTKTTHRLPAELGISDRMIPNNTNLVLNVYKSKHSAKYLYVRLRGLTQFKKYLCWNANCDVVLDFDTTINPRSIDYPFSTNREGLKSSYQGILEAIRDKVSQSPTSIARDNRYKETLYENTTDAKSFSSVVVSASVSKTMGELTKTMETIKGFQPQGGYMPATIADYISQYNTTIQNAIGDYNVSKADVVKSLPNQTLKQLANPLKYCWMVYEDTEWKHKRISTSKLITIVAIWELVLRQMASNYSPFEGVSFYPGIVLEDNTRGLCLEKYIGDTRRCYVMINPLLVPTQSNQKLALYLMGIAAHELAHCLVGSYEAHGETFSYTREAIMNANLDALDTIIKLVKPYPKSADTTYTHYSIESLESLALTKGVDVNELKHKYPNSNIYRMRLTMAIKKH